MNNTCEALIKEIQKLTRYDSDVLESGRMIKAEQGDYLLRDDVVALVAEYHPPVGVG